MPVGYSPIPLMVAIFARLAVSITQTTPFSATPETYRDLVDTDDRIRARRPEGVPA